MILLFIKQVSDQTPHIYNYNISVYDHIGGFNTLFYTLSNAGKIIAPINRTASKHIKLD